MDSFVDLHHIIVAAYRQAANKLKPSADPHWLSGAAFRIAERLQVRHQADDLADGRLRSMGEQAGRSLYDCCFSIPKLAKETWEGVGGFPSESGIPPEIRDFDPNHFPDPHYYLRRSFGAQTAIPSLESHWLAQSELIREDYEIRRGYGLLVSRFAVYERCNWHLDVLHRREATFLSAERLMAFEALLRRARFAYLSIAAIASVTLTWYLSRQSEVAIAVFPAFVLFAAIFVIFDRMFKAHRDWADQAAVEINQLAQLESAIRACSSEHDLDRCSDLAHAFFCRGYIEAKYVANVIQRPRPQRDA